MNVLFVSPHFPPHHWLFCRALHARGITVLGLGDAPREQLAPELRATLTDYAHVPHLEDERAVDAAVAGLVARHGRLDRVESHTEHWLGLDARLRAAFDVPLGARPEQLAPHRSKLGMAQVFREAGLPHPVSLAVGSREEAHAFARDHGFPLVIKPDVGVGASRTDRVDDFEALDALLDQGPRNALIQPFIRGSITTYDGMVDREGRIVFATSHVYDRGMMEILNGHLDGYYYSRREIPPALEQMGQRAVAAFHLRERFFHAEFFVRPDGSLVALEMNLRPPGGFSTDMMNFACDVDVYALWAAAVAGDDVTHFRYRRPFHAAHAGRRFEHRYAVPHDELVRRLGTTLVLHRPVPPIFATSMGDVAYLLRHPDERALLEAIALVQRPA